MHYACDLDFVKLNVSYESQSKLVRDIAETLAKSWQRPEIYMHLDYALRDAAQKDAFIVEDRIALITAQSSKLEHAIHAFYKLDTPLLIEGTQNPQECEFVFVVLSPKQDGTLHLRRLSRAARLMQDVDFQNKIKRSETIDELRTYFMYPEEEYDEKAA